MASEPNERLPRLAGKPVQLPQVVLNLITDAIDSMVTKSGERVLSMD